MSRLGSAVLTALSLVMLFALSAGAARASHVQCGDVITQDTTLDSDLIDCPRSGVVIGVRDITLDLGGHVIDGPNLPPNFFFDEPPDGVDNRAGHDRVTIQNGSIREFRQGVDIGGFREGIGETPSTGNVVRNMQISSDRGVEASVASELTLEGNTIQSRVWAVLAADTHDSVVLDNRATSIPPILGGASISILNGQFDLAGRNVIRGNRVSGGDIEIAGSGSLVTRNAVFGGLDAGVALMDPGNIASRNFVTGQSLGLFVRGNNRIVMNRAIQNRGDGIRVEGGNPELIRNTASGNRDDGIEINSAGTLVSKSRADDNGDLGIEAISGVVDGGKNRASGNGNPLQCLNVFCK